ncbi:MAG: hypothetical protein WC613_01345 [Candidatus Aenigmatarchaeota archaeon]
MVNFGSALERAWKYSTNLKRVGVFTLFLIISLSIVLLPLLFAYNGAPLSISLLNMMQFFVWLAVGIAVALLVYMYAALLFTHNYANQKSLGNSANYAKSRYLRFLGAMIVIGVISGVVSMVPFIGIVFSIIVGLILFFVPQEIAVGGSGISKSLTNSYNLFRKNIVDVVITLIVSAILSTIIMLIFAIPIFIVGFMSVISAMSTGNFMHVFLSNAPLFVVTGLILLVGVAFSILFSNSIRTDVYMQLKKKRK